MQDPGQQPPPPHASEGTASRLLPLPEQRRFRLIAATVLVTLAGAACLFFGLRPVAYHAMAMVTAPASAGALEGQTAWMERQQHDLEERELLFESLRETGLGNDPVVAAIPKGRAAPHISLRRTGQSEVVHVVATAPDPVSAAMLANKAAQLLVARERLHWGQRLPTLLQSGQITPQQAVQGPNIQLLHAAPVPRSSNAAVHPILRLGGFAGIIIAASLCILLLADRRARAQGEFSGEPAHAPFVNIIATLRVQGQSASSNISPSKATLGVQPMFWSWIATVPAMRGAAGANGPVVVLIAPCSSEHAITVSAVECSKAALYLARLAGGRGVRTLLADFSPVGQNPSASKGLQLPKLPGVSEVLAGQTAADEWFLEDDESPNLTALCAGSSFTDLAAMLSLQSMTRFIGSLGPDVQLLVVNCPPVLGEDSVAELWQDAGGWSDLSLLINSDGGDTQIDEQAAAALLEKHIAVIGQIVLASSAENEFSRADKGG